MGTQGLEGMVVRKESGVGGLTLTDERYRFPKTVQSNHVSQRSDSRECQSQEEGDPVQLESYRQTRFGAS